MQIDDTLITYLEDLSCLKLSGDEKTNLVSDIQNIMNGISKIGELNTDNVPECVHPFDVINVFRDDKVQPSLDRGLLLKNAPVKNDEMFIAPKTVE